MDADLTIGPPEAPQVRVDEKAKTKTKTPVLDGALAKLGPIDAAEVPAVDEAKVRRVLRTAGRVLGGWLGDDDVANHWHFTDSELDELVPPVTAIVNRRPPLRRVVQHSDEATAALVLVEYFGRNITAGQRAKEARGGDIDGEGATAPDGAAPGGGRHRGGNAPGATDDGKPHAADHRGLSR